MHVVLYTFACRHLPHFYHKSGYHQSFEPKCSDLNGLESVSHRGPYMCISKFYKCVTTKATRSHGGWCICSVRYFRTCWRIRIGTRNAVIFPQPEPVDATRIWDSCKSEESSWAGCGLILHCGMHTSMISQMNIQSSSRVHENSIGSAPISLWGCVWILW